MTMDRGAAKKVRYVFNPASENLVPAYVGVAPVDDEHASMGRQAVQIDRDTNKKREVLATQPARTAETKRNA